MSIFKKINSPDSLISKEGIRELYELKQQHPDIDIEKYCKGTSSRLKSYVDEQMRLIEQERSPPSSSSSSSSSSSGGSGSSSSSSSALAAATSSIKPPRLLQINPTNDDKPLNRRADDIMKTIADWKSKTQLNKLDDDDDNDENNIRTVTNTATNGNLGDHRIANSILTSGMGSGSSTRLFQSYQTNGNGSSRLNLNRGGGGNEASENSIKAEKYLDIVKDLKKKYTRSRTEVNI